MSDDKAIFAAHFSRRGFLTVAAGAAALATADTADADPAPDLTTSAADPTRTPAVAGLHLQFGADAASEVVVSWHALQPVRNARVLLGRPDGRYERSVPAKTVSYTDAKSGQVVYAFHASLRGLHADSEYVHAALHDGAEPVLATFTTAPRGRAKSRPPGSTCRIPRWSTTTSVHRRQVTRQPASNVGARCSTLRRPRSDA